MQRGRRRTPAGEHRAVLLAEVLDVLRPSPGSVGVDCTLGFAGHALELLRAAGPTGHLIALDLDARQQQRAAERLGVLGQPFSLHHGNFAGLEHALASAGIEQVDWILADLGMSSMQVDDAERGFSFMRDGPLDMRMDQQRGRTAAEWLAQVSREDLADALRTLGDEPEAERIANAILHARDQDPITRTSHLTQVVLHATVPHATPGMEIQPNRWNNRPLARLFQTLRMVVNRELGNLEHLLRVIPRFLRAGGRAAVISFHSGEDRLVKASFRDRLRAGIYSAIADEPLRPTPAEALENPRSRSAKLRWAQRA